MRNIKFENASKIYEKEEVISDLNLEINGGERLILLGPSGCGKSTILRMIAGLESITTGDLYFGDKKVNLVPPGQRNISMVFQNYALFPHMTVEDNITYALKAKKIAKTDIEDRLDSSLDILDLKGLEKRKPRELSGGQRQRVALARALVKQSDIFLLDEPLSNLDALLRVHARKNLLEIHNRFKQTMIYVTHDQIEAMTLGERIALLYKGDLQMIGTPTELYHRPVNIFTASFIGTPPMNLFNIEINEGKLYLGDKSIRLPDMWLKYLSKCDYENLVLGIRAERLKISDETSDYALTLPVEYVENYGNQLGIHFKVNDEEGIVLGDQNYSFPIRIIFNPNYFHFFDTKSTMNLGYPEEIEKIREVEYA